MGEGGGVWVCVWGGTSTDWHFHSHTSAVPAGDVASGVETSTDLGTVSSGDFIHIKSALLGAGGGGGGGGHYTLSWLITGGRKKQSSESQNTNLLCMTHFNKHICLKKDCVGIKVVQDTGPWLMGSGD